jgi:hypothetical protein
VRTDMRSRSGAAAPYRLALLPARGGAFTLLSWRRDADAGTSRIGSAAIACIVLYVIIGIPLWIAFVVAGGIIALGLSAVAPPPRQARDGAPRPQRWCPAPGGRTPPRRPTGLVRTTRVASTRHGRGWTDELECPMPTLASTRCR